MIVRRTSFIAGKNDCLGALCWDMMPSCFQLSVRKISNGLHQSSLRSCILMLDVIRSKQKSLLIKVAFGIIILSFVIGYTMLTAPSDTRTSQANDIAARVNGAEI